MQLWRRGSDVSFISNRTGSGQDEELLDAYSSAVVGVVEAVSPSVVHVQVRGSRQGRAAQGSGSGTILSPDGIVLTNNHVVEGASSIELSLTDARRVPARVLGRDPDTDIAVLRAEFEIEQAEAATTIGQDEMSARVLAGDRVQMARLRQSDAGAVRKTSKRKEIH